MFFNACLNVLLLLAVALGIQASDLSPQPRVLQQRADPPPDYRLDIDWSNNPLESKSVYEALGYAFQDLIQYVSPPGVPGAAYRDEHTFLIYNDLSLTVRMYFASIQDDVKEVAWMLDNIAEQLFQRAQVGGGSPAPGSPYAPVEMGGSFWLVGCLHAADFELVRIGHEGTMMPVDPQCLMSDKAQPAAANPLEGVTHNDGRTQVARQRRLRRQSESEEGDPAPESALATKPSGPVTLGPRDVVYMADLPLNGATEAGVMRSIIGALLLVAEHTEIGTFGNVPGVYYSNPATSLRVWAAPLTGSTGFMVKMDAMIAIQYLMVKEYVTSENWQGWRFKIKRSKKMCANGGILPSMPISQ